MKLAYFSPLSPQRSGISDYSEELLPYLAQTAEITLFVDGFEPTNAEVISRFEICDYRKQPESLKHLASFDAILYHMGNDHRYHTGIFETMVKYPGVLVLHDFALHDFFFNLAQTRKDLRLYLDEVGWCYGETVKRAASDALASGATPRILTNPVRFPLNDRLVRSARGVIVHSNWSRQQLAAIAPGALVQTIPHHITEQAAAAEASTDYAGGPVRIASFGLITPNKGIERALRALSALRGRDDFKYRLVGEPNPYFDVRSLIREFGLEDRVEITGHVELTDFQRHISQTDIAINLRESIIGETSGSLCRIMAAAVPAIVADAGWFGELPGDAVVKLDMNYKTDELLQAYLEALIVDEELRQKIGANARRHVLTHNDIRKSAEHYFAFISRVVDQRPEEYLVDALAKEIGVLGLNANTSEKALAQVAADIAPLVGSSVSARPGKEIVSNLTTTSLNSSRSNGQENGRSRKLAGVDYKQSAIDYVSKLDPERRHHLYTKPFYNLANKPAKYVGEGLDVDAFRHFCDFANIAVTLALPAGSTILDVGCGSGWLSEYFARLGYVVKGIDISPELIEMSRQRVARIPYPVDPETTMRCDFEVHDIEHAALNEQFDCVICYDSLHHFEDERAVIGHLAAATRYGGSLFILEGDRPAAGSASEEELIGVMRKFGTLESPFTHEYLRALLDENGFAVVGDYVSVNGLFERELVQGDLLRVNPPEVNYLLCKKVVREAGWRASNAPDSRKPSVLRAHFGILEAPPERIAPGELLSFRISIENSGDTLWLTSATPRAGIVMPATRVFDEAGLLVTEFHGEPLLPHAVAPGETVRIKIEYKAPQRSGVYRLKLDLVDQQVAWFEQRGSEPLIIQFEVGNTPDGSPANSAVI
jgi:2-polyprenyl-3-methyl-5-hydroxy-6-metoxy-1,4-benzoquinol methylase/glycosyltransferase involved in cell wall biosynthesis